MGLPDVAIRWLVTHSCSNTEVAVLSNVCRRWREIVLEAIFDQAEKSLTEGREGDSPCLLLLASIVRFLLCDQKVTSNRIESYCLAWFHPSGIDFKQIAIDSMDDSEDEVMHARDHRSRSPQPFAPSGEQSYAGSEEESKLSRRRSKSPAPLLAAVGAGLRQLAANQDKYVNCMYQWNGYREANEVLEPFGYAMSFVKNVVAQAKLKAEVRNSNISSGARSSSEDKKTYLYPPHKTFAVRGATLARPEGFCLCWDREFSRVDTIAAATLAEDSRSQFRQHEINQLVRRRNRRRRELQREVLPKVLYSAPDSVKGHIKLGIKQPCIQFLNIDSSHAVRLFTPPFKPGPVPTPITFFCVAVATEDGCFFSGLRSRFELGHLYPPSARDNMIERSPICLCTEMNNEAVESFDGIEQDLSFNKDVSFNSDDSSCELSLGANGGDPSLKCQCPFSSMNKLYEEDDDEQVGQVCRGKRGPGMWHLYTAVFDGLSSSIRIDGQPETTDCTPALSFALAASLDGLTIGADHTFDMSLCFGQGSDGEGEGAMAELAVFKGRLDVTDIEEIEKRLMDKHGISPPNISESDIDEEDQYSRLAHAMLSHAPHHKVFASGTKRVPLRYMTKHRLVAWRQTNPVTGEKIRVSRIGSKFGDSSSEW